METAARMFLSLRKFVGVLMPGFSWGILFYLLFRNEIDNNPLKNSIFETDPVFRYTLILFISYVIGVLNLEISFRILSLFGDKIDQWSKNWQSSTFFKFIIERVHIFDPRTLDEEVKEIREGGAWSCKMYVLANSPALSREILEIEGDINFLAGIFPPLFVFGIWTADKLGSGVDEPGYRGGSV